VYTRSTAALRIARQLDGAWPLVYLLLIVPRPLRDAAYRYFAAHRYKWFGELDACRVPTPELRSRFLEASP
jgi:predicted DCC family thiol-disulfide oxidoreductase YuxK